MGHTVPKELIKDVHRRGVTYRKRKEGLKKKTKELATLCDLQALLICFGANGAVETWPRNKQDIEAIIGRYRDLSQVDQDKYKHDTNSHLQAQTSNKVWEVNHQNLEETAENKELRLQLRLEAVRKQIQLLTSRNVSEDPTEAEGSSKHETTTELRNCEQVEVNSPAMEPASSHAGPSNEQNHHPSAGLYYPYGPPYAFGYPYFTGGALTDPMNSGGTNVPTNNAYGAPFAFPPLAPPPMPYGPPMMAFQPVVPLALRPPPGDLRQPMMYPGWPPVHFVERPSKTSDNNSNNTGSRGESQQDEDDNVKANSQGNTR